MGVLVKTFRCPSVPYAVSGLTATCEDVNWFTGFMNLFMISSRRVWFTKWNRYVCDKALLANNCYVCLVAICGVLQSEREMVFCREHCSAAICTTVVAITTIIAPRTSATTTANCYNCYYYYNYC